MKAAVKRERFSLVYKRCACGLTMYKYPLHNEEGIETELLCEACIFEGLQKKLIRLVGVNPRGRKPARRAR